MLSQIEHPLAPASPADPSDTPANAAFRADVHAGLSSEPKALPASWLYDAAGSALFEQICALPEYYPSRVETLLLEQRLPEIAALCPDIASVIEFGVGSAAKTPPLLRTFRPGRYMPIDIAAGPLADSCAMLGALFPSLDIRPVAADFTAPLPLETCPGPRLGFFPGSTIGNFAPQDAVDLLRGFAKGLGPDGWLLIGIDRVKDSATLLPAYDDDAGVTARFNRNILERINRELGGDIPVDAFRHHIVWNDQQSRIEMHLQATEDCRFSVADKSFTMRRGDTIHTENSYKYGLRDAHLLLRAAGWEPLGEWADRDGMFMLMLARTAPPAPAP